jgi:tight adherence protein B
VSGAALLAALAAGLLVAGAWEAAAAVERAWIAGGIARLVEPLRLAGLEGRVPTTPERRRLAAVATLVLLAAGWLLAGPLLSVPAAAAAPAGVGAVIRARRRRWRSALGVAAPACARVMADALGAGRSIRAAVGDAAAGLDGAAAAELARAARALDLGEGTEPVLLALRDRAASRPWDALIAAVLLQRDAGGDLAGLLRDLAAAQEAAERVEGEARTATAQARFTAWLVAGLPLGTALLAELASPGLLASLVANPLSAWFTGMAVVLQAAALVCVRALARSAR